jgi:hypothetical protein
VRGEAGGVFQDRPSDDELADGCTADSLTRRPRTRERMSPWRMVLRYGVVLGVRARAQNLPVKDTPISLSVRRWTTAGTRSVATDSGRFAAASENPPIMRPAPTPMPASPATKNSLRPVANSPYVVGRATPAALAPNVVRKGAFGGQSS